MVTTGALIHGNRARFLHYHPAELPLALQLGGHNAQELSLCARMAEDAGFSEVNLNCGCPSDRGRRRVRTEEGNLKGGVSRILNELYNQHNIKRSSVGEVFGMVEALQLPTQPP
jgi:hypothetical protein